MALALVLVALGVLAILFATDLRSWRSALASGDTRFAQAPASAGWTARTTLPAGLSRGLLGLSGQLAFRSADQSFVALHAVGNGVDNGYAESRARGTLEAVLLSLAQGPNALEDSEAENLLGILAFADSEQNGPSGPAPVDRSVADFQAAVQLDPGNEDAKFNLEWLLRELAAKGTRSGSTSSSIGPSKGHQGANGGTPGKGY
jgi:hypothetical protein